MQDWIRSVHNGIVDARNNRSRGGRNRLSSDKVSPVVNHRKIEMSDNIFEDDLDVENNSEQLVNATKDRVRGPQGRRLPQRKSMMPVGSQIDTNLTKQRSSSLSSPNEEDEQESPKSNGDHPKPDASAKKPIFGRLGGQHSALTKELELKLKSGLAPGGRKFHNKDDDEDDTSKSRTTSETEDMQKRIDALETQLQAAEKSTEGLRQSLQDIKRTSDEEKNKAEEFFKSVTEETKSMLKRIEEISEECKGTLAEMLTLKKQIDEKYSKDQKDNSQKEEDSPEQDKSKSSDGDEDEEESTS